MPLTPERLQDAYRPMLVIRKFEESIRSLYQQGKIRGSFHPCVGQEATAQQPPAALKLRWSFTSFWPSSGRR